MASPRPPMVRFPPVSLLPLARATDLLAFANRVLVPTEIDDVCGLLLGPLSPFWVPCLRSGGTYPAGILPVFASPLVLSLTSCLSLVPPPPSTLVSIAGLPRIGHRRRQAQLNSLRTPNSAPAQFSISPRGPHWNKIPRRISARACVRARVCDYKRQRERHTQTQRERERETLNSQQSTRLIAAPSPPPSLSLSLILVLTSENYVTLVYNKYIYCILTTVPGRVIVETFHFLL